MSLSITDALSSAISGLRIEGFEGEADILEGHLSWIDKYGEPEEWAKRAQAAHQRAEILTARLDGLVNAADWYVQCLRDVANKVPVRGLDEAEAGYSAARGENDR